MEQEYVDHRPKIPNEIIMHIVIMLAPDGQQLLQSSDETTKTLLSLMRTCMTTYEPASCIFARHCIYIDGEERALRFARSLASVRPDSRFRSPFLQISSLYLELFQRWGDHNENEEYGSYLGKIIDRVRDFDFGPLSRGPLRHSSLEHLNNVRLARSISNILQSVAPTLKRLIINMPLRLFMERHHQDIIESLRPGFEALAHLEDFTSIGDDLFLADPEIAGWYSGDVWSTCWPRLKRIALDSAIIDDTFWDAAANTPLLDTILVCRPEVDDYIDSIDVKKFWMNAIQRRVSDMDEKVPVRKLTWLHAELAMAQPTYRPLKKAWYELDPEDLIRVLNVEVPYDGRADRYDRDPANSYLLYTSFSKKHAVAGTMWNEELVKAYWPGCRDIDCWMRDSC